MGAFTWQADNHSKSTGIAVPWGKFMHFFWSWNRLAMSVLRARPKKAIIDSWLLSRISSSSPSTLAALMHFEVDKLRISKI